MYHLGVGCSGQNTHSIIIFFLCTQVSVRIVCKKTKNASILVTPEIRKKKKSFNYMYDVLITSETTIALI